MGPEKASIIKANEVQKVPRASGIKRREKLLNTHAALIDPSTKILGKSYFRDPDVNKGYYSKKREGVADVNPKVNLCFLSFIRSWNHLCLLRTNHQGK